MITGPLGMIAAAAIAAAVTGGIMWAREEIVVAGAVKGERANQVGICAQQLTDQALQVEADTIAGIALAGQAADSVSPTPSATIDIIAMCKADKACRSRGELP